MLRLAYNMQRWVKAVVTQPPLDPATIFVGGANCANYDISNLGSLWQDTAGTVAAVVDATVARVNDLSGNGFHLLQATAGSRWYLRQSGGLYWIESDGLDDTMSAAAGNGYVIPSGGPHHISAAFAKVIDANVAVFGPTQTAAIYHRWVSSTGRMSPRYSTSAGIASALLSGTNSFTADSVPRVVTGQVRPSTADMTLNSVSIYGAVAGTPVASTAAPMLLGSASIAVRFYAGCAGVRDLSMSDVLRLQRWFAAKCGVKL